MEILHKFLNYLKSLPTTGKILSIFSVVLALVIMLFFSGCSVMTIRVKGTKDNVSITTTQSRTDSSKVNVSVNPTINIKPSNDL